MLLYVDLDNTLINPVIDKSGNVVDIIPRPHVDWFLKKLAKNGSPWLLTAASRLHAERALKVIGSMSGVFKGLISIEDMSEIEDQLDAIRLNSGLSRDEKWAEWNKIRPIAPPGIMFDDYPVGSGIFMLKAAAIGIGADDWVKVDHYGDGEEDRDGLKKAYAEFKRRTEPKNVMGKVSLKWA